MRQRVILRLGALVCLFAISATGLLACVPTPAAPGAATPTPAATPPREFTGAPGISGATPPGGFGTTPTLIAPRAGAALASTTTKTYVMDANKTESLALQAGDLVVLTLSTTGVSVAVDVDDPAGRAALLRSQVFSAAAGAEVHPGITDPSAPTAARGKFSFQASVLGTYRLTLYAGAPGPGGNSATLVTEIWR